MKDTLGGSNMRNILIVVDMQEGFTCDEKET